MEPAEPQVQPNTETTPPVSEAVVPAAAPAPAPSSEPSSEAKPSFLSRLLNREPKREASGDVQDESPEPWKKWTDEDFKRHEQSLKDRGAFEHQQRTRQSKLDEVKADLTAAIAANDDYQIAALSRERIALEDDHANAFDGTAELARHRDDLIRLYDKDTLDVWLDKMPHLKTDDFKGSRTVVSAKLWDAAVEFGAAQAMDELRDGKTESGKALRQELLAEWHGITGNGTEPVHIEGVATTPPKFTDANAVYAAFGSGSISSQERDRELRRLGSVPIGAAR